MLGDLAARCAFVLLATAGLVVDSPTKVLFAIFGWLVMDSTDKVRAR